VGGDGVGVVLVGVVEVEVVARSVAGAQEGKGVVAGAAGHGVAAGIADQDIVAATAVQRLRAVGGDDDVVAGGAVQHGRGGRVVDHSRGRVVGAGGDAVGGVVRERAAGCRVIIKENRAEERGRRPAGARYHAVDGEVVD